ncbi:MAG: nucleotidyltransferase family protein [Patescibacteria group bacterium]|nr:nucleotidyltransferase family protein [Patescibacteria group bacterium]
MDKDKIRKKISSQLPLLRQKYHVKKLGIFGSFVRDQQRKGSDVDMLVELTSPIGFFDFVRLENFLTRTLKQKVDLVLKKTLKPAIKDDVLKETIYV